MTTNKLRVLCGSMLLSGLIGLSTPAAAANESMKMFFETQLENGNITQQQYNDLVNALEKDSKAMEEEVEKRVQEATKDIPEIKTEEGIEIASRDGKFEWGFFGRMMHDFAIYDSDGVPTLQDGTEIRRARLGMDGKLWGVWKFKAQFTILPGAQPEDLWLSYNGFNNTSIKVGQFKEPFGLEGLTSSKYDTFMHEAPVTQAFEPGRAVGIGAFTHFNNMFTLGGGVFSGELGDGQDDVDGGSYGATGRLTFSPIHTDNRAVHFGLAGSWRSADQGDMFGDYSGSLVTHISEPDLITTGNLPAEDRYLIGLEGAYTHNRFSAQAEYMRAMVDTQTAGDLEFDGFYIQGSMFLTNDHRPYDFKPGDFDKVDPVSPVGKGGYGAWEVALRYDTLDLSDASAIAPATAGEVDNFSVGLNWYATKNFRFTANYNQVLDNSGQIFPGAEPASFEGRAQFFW